MDRIITARPLDRKVFAEFGDVIDKCGSLTMPSIGE
jgi:ureidoglycolate hydrolase